SGHWCKKIRGKVHYFGKVEDDPKGVEAEKEWNRVRDDLYAAREPGARDSDSISLKGLVNEYLTHQERRRDAGEISLRTFLGMHATCENLVKALGKTKQVSTLRPDDFAKLKTYLAKTRQAVSLRNEMQRCRSFFRHAHVNDLISE
ncbi:MAG: hypothetical protein R3B91_23820, partial [Planctomycetaceae bacterium]